MNAISKVYSNRENDMATMLRKISGNKYYFGHQSVGYNIMGGIKQWEEETGVSLNILESKDLQNTDSSSFVHFSIGKNLDPYSKINEFVLLIDTISKKDSGSIAFFKFCYIDLLDTTDILSVYKYYKDKMLFLKSTYPEVKIVLFTVPVRSIQKGIKAIVKRILFMPVGDVLENKKRHEFNEMIINELGDEFPIFDLAKVETTLPDGSLNTYKFKDKLYPELPDLYAKDPGHLNAYGARVVAYNLISFLANEVK